jgi:hypothetical protein
MLLSRTAKRKGKTGERRRENPRDDLRPVQFVPLNKAPGGLFITFKNQQSARQ